MLEMALTSIRCEELSREILFQFIRERREKIAHSARSHYQDQDGYLESRMIQAIESSKEEALQLVMDLVYQKSVPSFCESSWLEYPIKERTISSFMEERIKESPLKEKDKNSNAFMDVRVSLRNYLVSNRKVPIAIQNLIKQVDAIVESFYKESYQDKKTVNEKEEMDKLLPLEFSSDVYMQLKDVADMDDIQTLSEIIQNNVKTSVSKSIDNAKAEKMAHKMAIDEIKNNHNINTQEEVEEALNHFLRSRNKYETEPLFEAILFNRLKKKKKEEKPKNDMVKDQEKQIKGLLNKSVKDTDKTVKEVKSNQDKMKQGAQTLEALLKAQRESQRQLQMAYHESALTPIQEAVNEYTKWNLWFNLGCSNYMNGSLENIILKYQ